MNEPLGDRFGAFPSRSVPARAQGSSANLADILERVLDKGIVIAGDIQINLLDIELLTIKLRLLVASVDKAKEMGIDWWENDPSLSSRAPDGRVPDRHGRSELAAENERLRAELAELRERQDARAALEPAERPDKRPARRAADRTAGRTADRAVERADGRKPAARTTAATRRRRSTEDE